MSAFIDAFSKATEPYSGYDWYYTGNVWFNPAESAAMAERLNTEFGYGITPEEITKGVWDFGNRRRAQFNFNPAVDEHGTGDAFTPQVDPFTIARESIASVLKARGKSDEWIHDNFFVPVLSDINAGAAREVQQRAAYGDTIRSQWESVTSDDGGLFGFGELLPAAILIGVGIATGGFGLMAGAGEAGALAAADAAAGLIPAADLAAMTGTAATTAGITGNAAIDTYISNLPSSLARNAAIQLVKSGDIDLGQLATGAVTGGLNAYGNTLVSDLGLDPSIAKGLTSAVVGTGVGLISGQDVGSALTGGLISGAATGVGNAVGTAVRDNMVDSEITNAAAQNNTVVDGEQAFSDNPVEPVQPPPVDTSTGGFSDLVSDLVSPNTAGSIAGTVAGNATGAVLADAATGNQNAAPITDTAVEPDTPIASVSFSSVLPQNVTDAERTTDWTGTRLMDAGRI